jgi:nitrite reductase/ring-hydroxylating ferredoxin subunit
LTTFIANLLHFNTHRKEVSLGEGKGKALLSKVNGEFFATSHLCPHYKAPMVKGVLSKDGRVMCPWHGACFRVQTGDIEDGPSVDGLQSYEVKVKGGRVYVKAREEGKVSLQYCYLLL